MTTITSENPEFWEKRYQEKSTPWDLGQPAPPFVTLLEEKRDVLKPGKMAVFGSGLGHDAAFFGQSGFEVTGFDYVQEAVNGATERYGHLARFVQADIFNMPTDFAGEFDYVLEHTCFCAIPPSRRGNYVESAARLLKPGGRFIGLFWLLEDEDGPPYKSDQEEILQLFSPYFEVEFMERPKNSIASRQDQELLVVFTRNATPVTT